MNPIFTPKENMIFAGIVSKARKSAFLIPLLALALTIVLPVLAIVFYIDWEIYFRVFDFLAGEDSEYWSAPLMACTGGIMMIAFHLLAKNHPEHRLVKLINRLSGAIIAIFAIGAGLYIAVILYNDSGGVAGSEVPQINFGEAVSAIIQRSLIDLVFDYIASPAAVLAFSLGIGGLSIVAMFIAHQLFSLITYLISEIYTRNKTLRLVLQQQRIIRECEKRLRELQTRDQGLLFQDEQYWRVQITDDVLDVISDHLMPHEQALQDFDFNPPEHRFASDFSGQGKKVQAAVKKIRAISADDILNAMNPPKLLRKPS